MAGKLQKELKEKGELSAEQQEKLKKAMQADAKRSKKKAEGCREGSTNLLTFLLRRAAARVSAGRGVV